MFVPPLMLFFCRGAFSRSTLFIANTLKDSSETCRPSVLREPYAAQTSVVVKRDELLASVSVKAPGVIMLSLDVRNSRLQGKKGASQRTF